MMLGLGNVKAWTQTGNSVGLLLNTEDSFNGYTLLIPSSSDQTYLIDNCGNLINQWTSEFRPALMAHLTPWGTMIRSGRIPSNFQAGGAGGLIEEFDWDGNLIWQAELSSNLYHQHHDIKPMPNGNILVLAWEYNSPLEAGLLGREPGLISNDGIWTEMIYEIEPVGNSEFIIRWEWHLKDHLVQDINSGFDNYGIISEHPELIDVNYPQDIDDVDLFHANAIDYNEERDQIVINFRNYDEFYIIDHSTTSEEAASHSGGNSGRGGDILYRYGNPAAYERGVESDKKFFQQHGANWGTEGIYKNNIIVFNNGTTRPQGQFSSIEIVAPSWNGTKYEIEENKPFGPDEFAFAFVGTPTSSLFSPRISNATILPNDNVLICNGQSGQFIEVNSEKEIVWEYINPVFGNGIAEQGDENPTSDVFATERYAVDFSGLPNDLQHSGPIELNSDYDCTIVEETVSTYNKILTDISLLNNPIGESFVINNDSKRKLELTLFDLLGTQIIPTFVSEDHLIFKEVNITAGYYLLTVRDVDNNLINTFRVIKN